MMAMAKGRKGQKSTCCTDVIGPVLLAPAAAAGPASSMAWALADPVGLLLSFPDLQKPTLAC